MALFSQLTDLFFSEQFCFYRNVAAIFGAGVLLKWMLKQVWQLSGGFCAFFLAPWGISRINLKKYGPWAVVTGASEGIGRGYALELARRGLNVVIMSRSQDKLQKVADEIKEKYDCEVRIIAVDFSDGQEIYPRIAEELQGLDIGILVNNVGYIHEYPAYFGEVPEESHYKTVQINSHTVIQMTRMLLPKMTTKRRGVIVNISSGVSDHPLQLNTVYSATKINSRKINLPMRVHLVAIDLVRIDLVRGSRYEIAHKSGTRFETHFSDALRKEYSSKGIIVQDVKPFMVATAMIRATTGISSSRLIPDPVTYARAAVATIGIQHTTYGYFYHALQGYLLGLFPVWLLDWMLWKSLLNARDTYLKTKAKQK